VTGQPRCVYAGTMNVRIALLVGGALALAGCPKKKADPVAPADPVDAAITIAPAAPSAAFTMSSAAPSAAPSAPPPSMTDCITVDTSDQSGGPVVLEGTVYSGKHSHPNGSMFTFYGMNLLAPRCVVGLDETLKTDDVQLMSMDDMKLLKKFDGAKVHVTGSAFPEHTAWHVRPVLISVETIAKIR